MSRQDPYANFKFLVEIDGATPAGFTEVSGLAAEIEPFDYREGGDRAHARKLPGLRKFGDVTLKRGFTADRDMWQWFRTGLDGQVQRRTVRIVLLDEDRNPVGAWTLRQAWITRWEGPHLSTIDGAVAIETIVLAHEGLEFE
ncbi:phage tail protein [Luteitalea sp. TBR-22]|uniref:phage tail protein n=1 Tax=Luteitalea sp. TBR-22 TaxID=2802971 RepID=UPI001AF256A1|nr:phage tail protein [Luteitalea sp. TBR-22]BCS34039.1 phage tail protein [Luteitalea sp. TBR-22]